MTVIGSTFSGISSILGFFPLFTGWRLSTNPFRTGLPSGVAIDKRIFAKRTKNQMRRMNVDRLKEKHLPATAPALSSAE